MVGPLSGTRVVELAGIGPAPFCGMMLADHGAEVVRIERPGVGSLPMPEPSLRGRRSIVLDLKQPEAVEIALALVETADALIEGYRPGVAERLGLGPDECLARNSRLVYGRVTGWGQEGPRAATAGHDIDYIALSGVLHAIGRAGGRPVPPLNLLGDYGGGGMLLAFGVVSALLHADRTGEGQVVDAAMVDGSALLAQPVYELLSAGWWVDRREANILDGHAPFYDTYETSDGGAVAVGALEPRFYAQLVAGLGLAAEPLPAQYDPSGWPVIRERFAEAFRSRTRDEWAEVFAGTDACVAPVLSLEEARRDPHNTERGTFLGEDLIPGPAPRFSRHRRKMPPPSGAGADTAEVLSELGYGPADVDRLRAAGVIGSSFESVRSVGPAPREET